MGKFNNPLPPLDLLQRYTINEACRYLRKCRASLYVDIKKARLPVIKEGSRTYVPGAAIAERSRSPEKNEVPLKPALQPSKRRDSERACEVKE